MNNKHIERYLDIVMQSIPGRIKETYKNGDDRFTIILDPMSNIDPINEQIVNEFIRRMADEYSEYILDISISIKGYGPVSTINNVKIGCITVLEVVLNPNERFITIDSLIEHIPDANAALHNRCKTDVRDLPMMAVIRRVMNGYNVFTDTYIIDSAAIIERKGEYYLAVSNACDMKTGSEVDKHIHIVMELEPESNFKRLVKDED